MKRNLISDAEKMLKGAKEIDRQMGESIEETLKRLIIKNENGEHYIKVNEESAQDWEGKRTNEF